MSYRHRSRSFDMARLYGISHKPAVATIRHDQLFSRLSLAVRQLLNGRWTYSTHSDWLLAPVCVYCAGPSQRRTHRRYICTRQLMVRDNVTSSAPDTRPWMTGPISSSSMPQYHLSHTPPAG